MDRRRSKPRSMSTYHLGVVPRQQVYHSTIWCSGCQSLFADFPSSGFALTIRQGNVYFVHWTSTEVSSVIITIMSSPTSSFLGGEGPRITRTFLTMTFCQEGIDTHLDPSMCMCIQCLIVIILHWQHGIAQLDVLQ